MSTCLFDASANLVRSSLPAAEFDSRFAEQLWRLAIAFPCLVHAVVLGFGKLPGVTLAIRPEAPAPAWDIGLRPLTDKGLASRIAIEIRPVAAEWSPFFVALPQREVETLGPRLRARSPDGLSTWSVEVEPRQLYEGWWVRLSEERAAPKGNVHCLECERPPSLLVFGQVAGEHCRMILKEFWGPTAIDEPPSALFVTK